MGDDLREHLLGLKCKTQEVDVTEAWGRVVTIREMDGVQLERFNEDRDDLTDEEALNGLVVVYSLIDKDTGEYVFKKDDLADVSRMPWKGLSKVALEAAKLSGLQPRKEDDPGN